MYKGREIEWQIFIYACRDNDGIIINNDKVKLMGQIEIIHE